MPNTKHANEGEEDDTCADYPEHGICLGVIVAVMSPLIWAILTQHRDYPPIAIVAEARPETATNTSRSHHARARRRSGALASLHR